MQAWKAEFYKKYPTINNAVISKENDFTHLPFAKHIIRTCFPPDRSITILDLGCGFGGFLGVCRQEGYQQLRGIDISFENVSMAHQLGLNMVEQGELLDTLTQIKTESYDIVLFLDVIEHFEQKDIVTILQQTFRILKKGGQGIIHVPNSEGIFGSRIRYADFTHEMAFTQNSLSQLFRFCGFEQFRFFEDKPIVHGTVSLIRNIIWRIGTFPFRILHAAETGNYAVILSQNMLCSAKKGQ